MSTGSESKHTESIFFSSLESVILYSDNALFGHPRALAGALNHPASSSGPYLIDHGFIADAVS
jgi:hypothetical protein